MYALSVDIGTSSTGVRLATYGGHLELSAFAHMTKRNVKVIQPGLVYVIEWDAGGGDAEDPFAQADTAATDGREKRRSRRGKGVTEDAELAMATGTAYVAYVSLLNCVDARLTVVQLP